MTVKIHTTTIHTLLFKPALTKRYTCSGHSNEEGKVAIYALEPVAHKKLTKDKTLTRVKVKRSRPFMAINIITLDP